MNQDSQPPSANAPLTVRRGGSVVVSDDWSRWLSFPAFYDLALSLGIPSDGSPPELLQDVNGTRSGRLNHLEVALPPRTNDQEGLTDETPFLSPDSGASSTPWDTGSSSSTYYDWLEHQHQDAPASGEAQPVASSSTAIPHESEQVAVPRPTRVRRTHASDGHSFSCDICGAAFARNWLLTRHRQENRPGLGGKRGRKPSARPRPFDHVE